MRWPRESWRESLVSKHYRVSGDRLNCTARSEDHSDDALRPAAGWLADIRPVTGRRLGVLPGQAAAGGGRHVLRHSGLPRGDSRHREAGAVRSQWGSLSQRGHHPGLLSWCRAQPPLTQRYTLLLRLCSTGRSSVLCAPSSLSSLLCP